MQVGEVEEGGRKYRLPVGRQIRTREGVNHLMTWQGPGCVTDAEAVKRVNPKCLHPKQNTFCAFSSTSENLAGSSFVARVSPPGCALKPGQRCVPTKAQ